jgi:hypothetical protein
MAQRVEAAEKVAEAIWMLAKAIIPPGSDRYPGTDATGGGVGSLAEAFMGITAGLVRLADALSEHADAVKELSQSLDRREWRTVVPL